MIGPTTKSFLKKESAASETSSKSIDPYLIMTGAVIFCISLIRFRLINIPLERDEGEFAYIGNLVLNGIAPFKEAYSMKLPGMAFMYALIMAVFGKTIFGIHLGLLLINTGSMVFFFLGFRKLFNSSIGFFTASVYGIMSLSSGVLGFAAHATQFVTFFVSAGVFFLARFYENKKNLIVFICGLMFGLSFLMKQQAFFFMIFGGLTVVLIRVFDQPISLKSILKDVAFYCSGAFTPYAVTLIILASAGALNNFWFWTVTYATTYTSHNSFEEGRQSLVSSITPMWEEFKFFWIFFAAGLFLIFLTKYSLRQKLIAILFTVFAFLSVCPGFYFRQHYFISFLPAVGLTGAIALDWLFKMLKYKKFPIEPFLSMIVFCFVSILAMISNEKYYLKASPVEISRVVYSGNPFTESPVIGNYIKEHSLPSDKIAVLGSEPQILFYADRISATGYIYTYGLMEIQDYNLKMQQQMISEIEKTKPKFVVYCDIAISWLPRPRSPLLIFKWFDKYSSDHYELAGIVGISPSYQSTFYWDNDAKKYQSNGMARISYFQMPRILVYKRKQSNT